MTAVWVTRDEQEGGPLSSALQRLGLEPVCEPVIERQLTADVRPLIAGLGPDDWLVLTSRFIVDALDASGPACHLAVVGTASRDAALARGLRVELMSQDGTGAGLWRQLRLVLRPGHRVCYPRSSKAEPPPDLPGIRIDSPVAYTTAPRAFDAGVARRVAAAAVASPSAVEALAPLNALPPLASIGPTTSDAIRRHHLPVWLEAPAPTLAALAEAIARRLSPASRPGTSGPTPAPRT